MSATNVSVILILAALIGPNRARSPDAGNLALATGCVGLLVLAIEITRRV
ncbi:hypothetical protein GGD83_004535 [Rhodoblastus sphagnicola]|nr:hypothetical protein [Rhodoblastus sphagnicola]MBB4200706.1 hypothetical protein [Rhodoblastus sphagnicola]